MPSFDEQALTEIETLFGGLKENSFTKVMSGAVPYETQMGIPQIAPSGFTSDSAVENVVGPAWEDFIYAGFYNSSFFMGTLLDIDEATLVGSADTAADYLRSLSHDLPYWVVEGSSGTGTFKRVADSAGVGGHALEWSGQKTASIFQDIPISPGRQYLISNTWKFDNSGGAEFTRTDGYQFRDSDHGALGVAFESGLAYTTTRSDYEEQILFITTPAPANARYLRITIEMAQSAASPVVRINSIKAQDYSDWGGNFPSNPFAGQRFFREDLSMEFFWSGTMWLSTTQFHLPLTARATNLDPPYTTSTTPMYGGYPLAGTAFDAFMEAVYVSFFIGGGGSALSASHKWVITVNKNPAGSAVATVSIDSGASAVWRVLSTSINALLGTTNFAWDVAIAKTGTPGSLHFIPTIIYRLVAT